MRTGLQEHNLSGNVRSVETSLVDMSTKSYRLRPNGREELEDFGNPSDGSPGSPLLWEVFKFDARGKLVEDIDVERPLIEQDSYRYVYTYNQQGFLVERAGYRENGSSDGRTVYIYDPGGKKTKELIYSSDARVQSRYEFDEHENFTSVEWFKEDGTVRQKQTHRYEYLSKGNTLEQIYYPPEVPPGVGFTFYAPRKDDAEKAATIATPPQYRTVIVRDGAGHVREQSRYDVDGSLLERKVFDQDGILRSKEWRLGEATVTTTLFNDQGREVEAHTIAKKGFLSPRAVDDRTLFFYDEYGNLKSMVTSGPGGSLVAKTTNAFVYDGRGNWIEKIEVELNNTWQTEPFPAAFETISQFRRIISYFPEN
jgi:antitoxin component YwqK of YwqJK toxin-antitoxin module